MAYKAHANMPGIETYSLSNQHLLILTGYIIFAPSLSMKLLVPSLKQLTDAMKYWRHPWCWRNTVIVNGNVWMPWLTIGYMGTCWEWGNRRGHNSVCWFFLKTLFAYVDTFCVNSILHWLLYTTIPIHKSN